MALPSKHKSMARSKYHHTPTQGLLADRAVNYLVSEQRRRESVNTANNNVNHRSTRDTENTSKTGVPKGIRTPVAAVKGQCPRPLDDGDTHFLTFFWWS